MGQFGKGDRVGEARYGAGEIVSADERYIVIEFDDGVVRKFVTSLVRLVATTVPKPVSPEPARRRRRRQPSNSDMSRLP